MEITKELLENEAANMRRKSIEAEQLALKYAGAAEALTKLAELAGQEPPEVVEFPQAEEG